MINEREEQTNDGTPVETERTNYNEDPDLEY